MAVQVLTFWGLFSRPIEFEKSSLEEFCLSFIVRVNETVGTRVHSLNGEGGVVLYIYASDGRHGRENPAGRE